ncbi:MAG: serine/threonine-protein kinase [Sandaracinaceae bacterium]
MKRGPWLDLSRRIARSKSTEVWLAFERRPDGPPRRVVVKRAVGGPREAAAARASFEAEAALGPHLVHPNIVEIHGAHTLDGAPVLVMEHVDGLDAAEALRRAARAGTPMPASLAAFVTSELASALAHAHAARDDAGRPLGLVHRDVNPPNVLLGRDGRVKLADFGIATTALRHGETTTGIVKGKEAYLAPEQLTGQAVTSATDVYALGVTLHHLATGRAPLETWADVARRAAGGDLVLDPALDPSAAALVARAMSIDPVSRPTARELAVDASDLASRLDVTAMDGPALARWLEALRARTDRGAFDSLFVVGDPDERGG